MPLAIPHRTESAAAQPPDADRLADALAAGHPGQWWSAAALSEQLGHTIAIARLQLLLAAAFSAGRVQQRIDSGRRLWRLNPEQLR